MVDDGAIQLRSNVIKAFPAYRPKDGASVLYIYIYIYIYI